MVEERRSVLVAAWAARARSGAAPAAAAKAPYELEPNRIAMNPAGRFLSAATCTLTRGRGERGAR